MENCQEKEGIFLHFLKICDQECSILGTGSSPDLESQFKRKGVRATVCSSQIKARSQISSSGTSSKITPVARSQSMKKPFQKIGDGFLKTFRQLKKRWKKCNKM